MTGKVWLVGAGPGDVGLFTLKGLEVLKQADVVVYDALVGQSILSLIPDSARLIFAGKRSGNHVLSQEEINRILLDEAVKGNRVVRLKGGDPFLFGRGGEELELLTEHAVPFEIVPGITSALAVPAYLGIPVTHRDYCSSVHIITGHRRKESGYDIDFDALVRTGGTLVFLMGIAALPEICRGLLNAGMDKDIPAAVLERGTTSAQRRISATLSTLEEECAKAEVTTPAIIVVGRVCELAERFGWAEKRPLSGVKVILTRPRELSSGFAAMLREKGAEVLELPAIRTELMPDPGPVRRAIQRLVGGGYDWIVFTSPSGVRVFFRELLEISDLRALCCVKIAAIGQGTAKALLELGLKADFIPTTADGETLGTELYRRCSPDARILIPRAASGGQELIHELERDGRRIDDVALYQTVYTSSKVIDPTNILDEDHCYAVFTSASTVHGFAGSVPGADYHRIKAVCIGRQTAAAAEALGMQVWVSSKATLESLEQELEEAARGKSSTTDQNRQRKE